MNISEPFLNKPIIMRFTVLELSKIVLFKHCLRLKKKYSNKLVASYTDTDSMKLIIETDDAYSDADKKIEYYDTTNFPKCTKFNITPGMNEKEPGLLKFDNAEICVTELICKASKSYREKR